MRVHHQLILVGFDEIFTQSVCGGFDKETDDKPGKDQVNIKINDSNNILQRESETAPFKTTAWYIALDTKAKLKATSTEVGKGIIKHTGKPKSGAAILLMLFLGELKKQTL